MCSERIKERLANERELFRAVVLFILALLSGIVVNIYQVLAQKTPFYTIVLSAIGFVILIRLGLYGVYLFQKLQELEEELECLG